MRPVRFLAAAAEEAEAAADWYTRERRELGADFEGELDAAVARMAERPEACPRHPHVSVRGDVRRQFLRRFPYQLVFVERDGVLIVLAVAHLAKRPGYWKQRLRD
ncbi:MAG TPA: type II toxin-antitoxin system RelE/ParE family toxin [Arenimonas sp.]|nr:type II toxin-antitoxin system RelE/ParE family toxin [Arenimonas sp.]